MVGWEREIRGGFEKESWEVSGILIGRGFCFKRKGFSWAGFHEQLENDANLNFKIEPKSCDFH